MVMKIILALVIFSAGTSFGQAIIINPGDQIIIQDAPTLVFCKAVQTAFKTYCKCLEEGFSRTPTLEMVLDAEGNRDVLASYATTDLCESALRTNPTCAK